MEDFVYQESKDLYMAMVRGESISWPKTCRNCDFEFPSNLKSEISKSLMDEPLVDLLKLTSTTFRKHCSGHNYCCINNFKPSFKRPFTKQDENISYYVFSETLCIEEGLVDWYDVEWPDFDQEVILKQNYQGETLEKTLPDNFASKLLPGSIEEFANCTSLSTSTSCGDSGFSLFNI